MTVFKYYFKLIKSFLPVILMYTVIFTFFGVVATSSGGTSSQFEMSKLKFAIHNEDQESRYTDAFIDYLKQNGTIVDVEPDEEQDALFYRTVDTILTIPKGFGASVLNGNPLPIPSQSVPDSANGQYLSILVNHYLSASEIYVKSGFTETQLIDAVKEDMKLNTEISLFSKEQDKLVAPGTFFNFANYTILATCIFIVGITMNIFYHTNIKRRNFASPISHRSINMQLFLGNSCMVGIIWLAYILISIGLYGTTMFTPQGFLLMFNFFLFSVVALSIGFLVGILVKDQEAQSGIVNVLALGSSFLCGAFVPQAFLGTTVLNIAHIFPSYWFIKNNDEIILLSNFTKDSMLPIILRMGVLILFVIGIFLVANIASKRLMKKTV